MGNKEDLIKTGGKPEWTTSRSKPRVNLLYKRVQSWAWATLAIILFPLSFLEDRYFYFNFLGYTLQHVGSCSLSEDWTVPPAMEACSPHIWTGGKFCIISFCHVSRQEVQHPEQCGKQCQSCCGPQVRVPRGPTVYVCPIRKSCLLQPVLTVNRPRQPFVGPGWKAYVEVVMD